jgi:hypothetical protein
MHFNQGCRILSSAECRERAAEKTAEAEGDTRHKKRLLMAAEGWLNSWKKVLPQNNG